MEIVPNEEEIAIDVILLAIKSPRIIDGKIHKEGKKIYYQIVRANGKSQMYLVFSHMLKSFDSEDLEDLYKLVKARYGSTRPVEDLDLLLWNDLKNMFEPHAEDVIYMLVEKNYPLTPPTISQMLEKKLQIDYEIEMAYQLCKLIIKQLKKGGLLGLKVFLMLFRVTATLIDVNAAQSKLVLLENFNKNYSKCLRLLYKVNATKGVNVASEEVSTAELVSTAYVIYQVYYRMDNLNITMEEYIRLEEEKARRYDMAPLLPRDQRHLWLLYQVEGYTMDIVHDFEKILEMIFRRQVYRVHTLDFEGLTLDMRQDLAERLRMVYTRDDRQEIFVSHAWRRLFEIRAPLLGGARRSMTWRHFILALGLHTAEEMIEGGFKAYCMDQWAANVPYLLAQYLFRHIEGRKSGAKLSGGHFIRHLAHHFGLVSDDGLRGLSVVTHELPLIDIVVVAATLGDAEDALDVDEGAKAVPTSIHAPPPLPVAASRSIP
ncbi:hypothetical protein Tco_1117639 [Tanacetum coccineum]